MARKSAIDTLDPAIRSSVLRAIEEGATIDDIVALVRSMGGAVSRSAVGRYTQRFADLAKQQRDMRTVAEAFGREFGSADDHQARMMTQLITSLVTRTLIPLATADADDEEAQIDGLELSRLAKAAKDAVSASKIDIEREARIREEEGKRARDAAAAAADAEGRAAGASEETIRRIRARILGIAA
jgi:hypothetical protein